MAESKFDNADCTGEALCVKISRKTRELNIPSAAHNEVGGLKAQPQVLVKALTQCVGTIGTCYKEGDLVSSLIYL
jgi:hypothetical protein